MAAIHGKDTKPELVVRRYLWWMSYVQQYLQLTVCFMSTHNLGSH